MHWITASMAACFAALAVPRPGPQGDAHFPAPAQGITIDATTADGGPSMADVLRAFAAVAGQNLSISMQTRAALEQTPAGLIARAEVPREEVYSFVGGLLIERGFVMSELRDHEPRLLGIYGLQQEGLSAPAIWVPATEIERFRGHPALMVSAVLVLEHLDVRQLGNSLRALLLVGSTIVPIGMTNAVLLRGPGGQVAELAQVMLAANEAMRASGGPRPPEQEATEDPEKGESEKQVRER